jgi:nucleoid-associated protein YgaU
MWRVLMALALAVAVLSALSAAAALLQVDGGTLQVFEYPAPDIELLPPIDGCGDDCGSIESTAQDGGNPAKHMPARYEIRPGDTLIDIAARFGTTVEALVQLNGVQDPNLIFYGSTLSVPDVGGELGGATVGVSP